MVSDSYNPKKALWALLSDDAKKLFNNAKDAMTAAEKRLSERNGTATIQAMPGPRFTNLITGSVAPRMSMRSSPRSPVCKRRSTVPTHRAS
jgi:hypothetical protein